MLFGTPIETVALLVAVAALLGIGQRLTGTHEVVGRAFEVLALPTYIVVAWVVGTTLAAGFVALIAGGIVAGTVRYIIAGR